MGLLLDSTWYSMFVFHSFLIHIFYL